MKYHIHLEDGRRIASFSDECERDYCIDLFRELYPDCIFDAVDDK